MITMMVMIFCYHDTHWLITTKIQSFSGVLLSKEYIFSEPNPQFSLGKNKTTSSNFSHSSRRVKWGSWRKLVYKPKFAEIRASIMPVNYLITYANYEPKTKFTGHYILFYTKYLETSLDTIFCLIPSIWKLRTLYLSYTKYLGIF